MPALRQIVLNGNAGAFTTIVATLAPKAIELTEDEASSTTGLQIKTPYDNFVTVNTYSFTSEPVKFPAVDVWSHFRKLLGFAAQGVSGAFNYIAASTLAIARSNGSGGTTLRFTEYE